LRCPVVVYQGKVLDGRARLAACEIAGVEPGFTMWSGEGSPIEWYIETNVLSHKLTYDQRVVLAHDALPLLKRETRGESRNEESGAVGRSRNDDSVQAAARITRTSAHHVRAVEVIEGRRPNLLDAVRCGDITLSEAKRRAGMSWWDCRRPRR
jgi:ParB family chromosome partitioning protein